VKAAGINPLDQYDQSGWKEGRDPSTLFDTKAYLAAYPDVAAAHIDPLAQFLQHGPPKAARRTATACGAEGEKSGFFFRGPRNPKLQSRNFVPVTKK